MNKTAKNTKHPLNYPFSVQGILKNKKKIKDELIKNELIDKKIAILGGSTTAEIKNILALFLLKEGINAHFYESEYNKYYEDSMFINRELESFDPDIIYFHTSLINLQDNPCFDDDEAKIKDRLKNEINRFKEMWESAFEKYNCAIIQNNFEYPGQRLLGNMDSTDRHGLVHFVNDMNALFAEYARENRSFYINDINYLASLLGLEKWHDQAFWLAYKYAISFEGIPYLSHSITSIIKSMYGKSKKCLVLDLDNTIWGGTIGDDGLDGIKIGNETAIAEAHLSFQLYIKKLKDRGILLAVCSKNDEENAKLGFQHSDSILKLEDFSCFKANWLDKDQNIMAIAQELNIGLDSMVFIDDDPTEREWVKSQMPGVSVPDIGNDITKYIDCIERESYFETVALSDIDLDRSQSYADNRKRTSSKSKFASYDDFLKSLDLTAEIRGFKPAYLERITQLINKTNQFNLTAKKHTQKEIEEIFASDNFITLYAKLADKFGNYGLTSVIIGKKEGAELHIYSWLMSCRVLKRNLEFAIFDVLVEHCRDASIEKVIGYYHQTKSNGMVKNFYKDLGFIKQEEKQNNSSWVFDGMSNFSPVNRFIQINK